MARAKARGRLEPGWTLVAFGDVARQVKDHVDPVAAHLRRYIAGEHMDSDLLRIRRWGTVGDGYLGPAFHMRFRPGHILYGSRRTYLRKVAVAEFEGVTANTTFVIETRAPDLLLPELLPFIMQTESFHEHSIQKSKGSVNPYVNFSDIAAYEFALPPKDEQRRMANLLAVIEAASRALQDSRAALTTLHKSTLMDSFGRLQEDPAVPRLPVGQVGDVLLGRQRAPQHEAGPSMRPYLRAANVFDGHIDTTDVKSMNFAHSEYERYGLKKGDVLLIEGNSSRTVVGRSAVFQGEVPGACFQNTLVRFRPGPEVLASYAHQYFRYCVVRRTFASLARQTSIAHLGAQNLTQLPMPVPDRNRQVEVIGQLSSIDAAAPATRDREQRLRNLKTLVVEPLGA